MKHFALIVLFIGTITTLISTGATDIISEQAYQFFSHEQNILMTFIAVLVMMYTYFYFEIRKRFYKSVLFSIMYHNENDAAKFISKYNDETDADNPFSVSMNYICFRINKKLIAENAFKYRFKKSVSEVEPSKAKNSLSM